MTDAPNRYDIRVSATARKALIDRLPQTAAFAAWEFIDGPLRDNPHRVGKPLGPPFQGCFSARRGTYRIRYEIDEDTHAVNILDIAGRPDIYNSARA